MFRPRHPAGTHRHQLAGEPSRLHNRHIHQFVTPPHRWGHSHTRKHHTTAERSRPGTQPTNGPCSRAKTGPKSNRTSAKQMAGSQPGHCFNQTVNLPGRRVEDSNFCDAQNAQRISNPRQSATLATLLINSTNHTQDVCRWCCLSIRDGARYRIRTGVTGVAVPRLASRPTAQNKKHSLVLDRPFPNQRHLPHHAQPPPRNRPAAGTPGRYPAVP